MAKDFKGLKKEDHEKLQRAVTMYTNLTGERIDVGGIPVEEPEKDAKAEAKKAKKALEEEAEVTREVEKARQRERQLKLAKEAGEVQDENPGPGMPAMVTERAKAQGVSRKGEEPAVASPKK